MSDRVGGYVIEKENVLERLFSLLGGKPRVLSVMDLLHLVSLLSTTAPSIFPFSLRSLYRVFG